MSEPYGQYPQANYPRAYGQPYPPVPQEHPQGTTILVLGILGVFVAGVCAPFAWYLGSKALNESRATGTLYSNQQSIVIGRVLGIVMTILMILAVLFGLVAIGLFIATAGIATR